jgi:hypothetical protein
MKKVVVLTGRFGGDRRFPYFVMFIRDLIIFLYIHLTRSVFSFSNSGIEEKEREKEK